jgi:hypothetical protein
MRNLGKSSAATSRKMGKSDERLAFHQTLQLRLSSEERVRPRIEEQFPFVHADLDQLSTNTIKLEASVAKLEASVAKLEASVESLCNKYRNTAIEMEAAVCALFDVWLGGKALEFGDRWRIVLPDGKIFSGKNVCLVQWDGIFGTSKNGEVRLILIETKEIPHSNDLIIEGAEGAQNGKTLYGRGKKTLQYLRDLCDESKSRSNYGPMRSTVQKREWKKCTRFESDTSKKKNWRTTCSTKKNWTWSPGVGTGPLDLDSIEWRDFFIISSSIISSSTVYYAGFSSSTVRIAVLE